MVLFKNIHINDEADTIRLAKEFSGFLQPGDCVVLNGDLGVGKTFFVKRLAEEFGVASSSSPSFSLVNIYEGSVKINHFDFYRLKSGEELFDIGFYEYVSDSTAITLIEWGNNFPEYLPEKRIEMNFSFNPDLTRTIQILK